MPCIRCQLQRGKLTDDVTRFKNLLTAYLDQIFLDYGKMFSDIGDVSSSVVLRRWLTPDRLLTASLLSLAHLRST